MEEFANGATQVSVRLTDERVIPGVLIAGSTNIVAARGVKDLPFSISEIADIFQTDEDKNPKLRGEWDYWDSWIT